MENKANKKQLVLLPATFKFIGLGVAAMAFGVRAYFKMNEAAWSPEMIESVRSLSMSGLILGIFLFAMSKDKVEDEMTLMIRLRAMGASFTWGALTVIIRPIVDIVSGDKAEMINGQTTLMSMLFVFILIHFLLKRNS